jgi:5'-nucleotidase
MKTILLTNDDGIYAPGLSCLRDAISKIAQVVVIAPERDNSAISHSLTMSRPLRVRQLEQASYAVDGTPADCITLAVGKILVGRPDLVISGINPGENIGDDINYSGTVSAAVEGTMLGIPSMAISLAGEEPYIFPTAAKFAAALAKWILKNGLPSDTLLNVNVPNTANEKPEICFTRQGRRTWEDAIKETRDPWGRKHYWIGGGTPSLDRRMDTDAQAVVSGKISITPIHLDLTNHKALRELTNSSGLDFWDWADDDQ